MNPEPAESASIVRPDPGSLRLAGAWTVRGIGGIERQAASFASLRGTRIAADAAGISALDATGAWVLQSLLLRLRGEGADIDLRGLPPAFARLLENVTQRMAAPASPPAAKARAGWLGRVGLGMEEARLQSVALLAFVGEFALALAAGIAHPSRLRWRPVLYNIRSAGVAALPIVALLSFLLGVVIAYQGADQLRKYGANIFVADLVGLSMVREFAPLIIAIIVAGRSGSAYAAQIGTMAVTEEIDALRTLGIAPLELLVLPKLLALLVVLPLLTAFADVMGVFGGMVMASAQLGVGFAEFLERLPKAVSVTAYLIGIGKAPVFAFIIATVGCFQGFRTTGGADSVGRQTTRSVVQAIVLVIVADALFSVAFSALGI